jgi:SH3-like domain-containing protein
MEGWKSFGVFLTGFAAVVTAATALLTYIIESGLLISNVEPVKQKEEQIVKVQQFATIKDPDGWVNVRELPSVHSKPLFKLNNKEVVNIIDEIENWYRIKTNDNRYGYVYFDRIELIYNEHFIKK